MPSAGLMYPVLQLLGIAAFLAGFATGERALFFTLAAVCACAALLAFLARERSSERRP